MATSTTTNKSTTKKSTTVSDDSVKADIKVLPQNIDINQYVTVRNGFQGTLVYQSSRTGESFVWDSFGDSQEMELIELKNAKSAHKRFFINNWFMFDEAWIPEYLGMSQYYKNAIDIDEFDEIFTQTPSALKKTLEGLSAGQKKSVSYRAHQLIEENKIDSIKVINTLEDCLGIELIER